MHIHALAFPIRFTMIPTENSMQQNSWRQYVFGFRMALGCGIFLEQINCLLLFWGVIKSYILFLDASTTQRAGEQGIIEPE